MINYEGRLLDGTVLELSHQREAIGFEAGVGQMMKGWDLGVMSMRLGEKAELTVTPEYGYGKDGAPEGVPPDATIVFTITLLQIGERRPSLMRMGDSEKIRAAEKFKADGNELFKAKDYKHAEDYYRQAMLHA